VANSQSIAAATLSLQELLARSFKALAVEDPDTIRSATVPSVRIFRSDDFGNVGGDAQSTIRFPTLAMLCYRVDVNRAMRAPWSGVGHVDSSSHLPLDLHFLLTPFDSDAEGELKMLGATMMTLDRTPILTGPRLYPKGEWEVRDSLQILNEDLVTEDVMRTFDTLPGPFRLSVAYVVRIVRVDASVEPEHPDVTTVARGLTPTPVP
jgi:hypothetical protein